MCAHYTKFKKKFLIYFKMIFGSFTICFLDAFTFGRSPVTFYIFIMFVPLPPRNYN